MKVKIKKTLKIDDPAHWTISSTILYYFKVLFLEATEFTFLAFIPYKTQFVYWAITLVYIF